MLKYVYAIAGCTPRSSRTPAFASAALGRLSASSTFVTRFDGTASQSSSFCWNASSRGCASSMMLISTVRTSGSLRPVKPFASCRSAASTGAG